LKPCRHNHNHANAGGARGLGLANATALATVGANVYIADKNDAIKAVFRIREMVKG
jgi:NAD(P)-dependent dehydrogenase (short-subunit alcohol dehydrogenase family)